MHYRSLRIIVSAVVAVFLAISGALAGPSPAPGKPAAKAPAGGPVQGPATITLGDKLATLALPKGFVFFNKDEAIRLLKENGAFPDGSELGLIVADSEDFFIVIEYEDVGYVKDDDAGKINADEILKSYQDGTEENNAKRREAGQHELHVTGWAEPPRYDASAHQVIWALIGKSQDSESVNYFTRKLGRHGVLSLNLVTDKANLEKNKKRVATILNGTSFVEGKRYADYQPGVDKDSGMGLTGLILAGGGLAAASKLGILAKLGKLLLGLLLVLKKGAVLVLAGLYAVVSRFFGGKKTAGEGSDENDPPRDATV